MKQRILILYDYFSPAFRAGGPIRSLENLIMHMQDQFDFFVICRANEVGEKNDLPGIKVNAWNNWNQSAKVFYWKPLLTNVSQLKSAVREIDPDAVFINGLYSLFFNILPVFSLKEKIILSARGMLHPGALSQKSLKKKIFLLFFKLTGKHRRALFHATDEQEKTYIQHKLGKATKVIVAGNFPNVISYSKAPEKLTGQLKLVTVALISPMKNHLVILQSLKKVQGKVIYTIWGPVKDKDYWKICESEIRSLPANIEVHYKGELDPARVPEEIAAHHVLISPSKSENFGHAIFEALVCGRPVITTNTTPWLGLDQHNAGKTISLDTLNTDLPLAIQEYADIENAKYQTQSVAAREYALKKINIEKLREQYIGLFNH